MVTAQPVIAVLNDALVWYDETVADAGMTNARSADATAAKSIALRADIGDLFIIGCILKMVIDQIVGVICNSFPVYLPKLHSVNFIALSPLS